MATLEKKQTSYDDAGTITATSRFLGLVSAATKNITPSAIKNYILSVITTDDITEGTANLYSPLREKSIGNIITPLVDFDLQNSLNLVRGVGSVTFTRSTVKNYVDRYGVVQEAAVDTPAFEKEGCLLEGASTNLLLQSEDFATTWALTRAGLTANAETAPDGTATAADKLKQTVTASSKYVSQTLVDDSTADYTFSVFAKKGEVESVRIIVADSTGQTNRFEGTFNLATGVVTSSTEVGTGAITAAVIKELANDWYRISISGTPSTVDTNEVRCAIELSGEDDSNTTDGLYIWGAQVEELPFASSYIINVDTALGVPRAADVYSIVRAENKPDSLDDFTVIADINMIGTKEVYTAVLTSGDLQLRVSESIINDGSTRIYMGSGMVTPPIIKTGSFRFGVTYSNPSLKMFHDGVLVSETSSATASDAGTANITIGDADAFSHISNLRIYNKALTDNEMRIA